MYSDGDARIMSQTPVLPVIPRREASQGCRFRHTDTLAMIFLEAAVQSRLVAIDVDARVEH